MSPSSSATEPFLVILVTEGASISTNLSAAFQDEVDEESSSRELGHISARTICTEDSDETQVSELDKLAAEISTRFKDFNVTDSGLIRAFFNDLRGSTAKNSVASILKNLEKSRGLQDRDIYIVDEKELSNKEDEDSKRVLRILKSDVGLCVKVVEAEALRDFLKESKYSVTATSWGSGFIDW